MCGSLAMMIGLAACADSSSNGISPDTDATNDSSSSAELSWKEGNGNTLSSGTEIYSSSSKITDAISSDDSDPFTSNTESSSSEAVSSSSYEGIDPQTVVKSTVTDNRDGRVYKTVKIGNQTWLAENLKYAYVVENDSGNVVAEAENCGLNEDSLSVLGCNYTWAMTIDSAGVFSDDAKGCGYKVKKCVQKDVTRGVCMEGWHVPTLKEWQDLFETVGGYSVAGFHLKSAEGWPRKNVYVIGGGGYGMGYMSNNGDDLYGFSSQYNGSLYWTADTSYSDIMEAFSISIYEERSVDSRLWTHNKQEYLFVRCVSD